MLEYEKRQGALGAFLPKCQYGNSAPGATRSVSPLPNSSPPPTLRQLQPGSSVRVVGVAAVSSAHVKRPLQRVRQPIHTCTQSRLWTSPSLHLCIPCGAQLGQSQPTIRTKVEPQWGVSLGSLGLWITSKLKEPRLCKWHNCVPFYG